MEIRGFLNDVFDHFPDLINSILTSDLNDSGRGAVKSFVNASQQQTLDSIGRPLE